MVINRQRIETMLAERKMTKTSFAKKAGISPQNLSIILMRSSCEPKTVAKLAEGLGVPVEAIIS